MLSGLWLKSVMYLIFVMRFLCSPVVLGPVAIHSAAHHALYGRVVHEGGAVWPGQALAHPGCGSGLEGAATTPSYARAHFFERNPSAHAFVFMFQSLSMLLNGTPFAFVIDLAALASRREYLKLDKWLTDKIREHGVSVCVCVHVSVLQPVLDCCDSKRNVSVVGTVHSGLRNVPEETLSHHHGRTGSGKRPAKKCTTASRNVGDYAGLSAVLCRVRNMATWLILFIYFN